VLIPRDDDGLRMNRDREDPPADIVGLSMEEAVEAVLTANESKDPEEVRQVLDHVTENGVVTEAAAEQTLSDVSMVLTTAESRVEYASTALSDAKEAVADVTDVPTVESRLDRFEKHVETVEELSVELGNDLQRIIDRRDDWGVYESTVALRELTTDAQEVQRTADDLKFDIEDLERYVTDPSVRVDELVADVDEVAGFLDGVEASVETVATADEGDDATVDPGMVWFDATLRHRVAGLLVADLRSELDDHHTLLERGEGDGDVDVDSDTDLEGRVEGLDDRRRAVGDRLDGLVRSAWTDRFDDRVSAFEEAIAGYEPPVDWAAALETLEEHRPDRTAFA
jgi:virulence-associated protein VapD